MFPEYDALVVLNCGEAEDYKVMKVFWKYFPECFGYGTLPENKAEYQKMLDTIDNCSVEDLPKGKRNFELEKKISNRLIKCKTSEFVSVVSITITQMWFNKPGEINEMMLTFDEDKLRFYWKEKEDENTIDVGLNGEYEVSKIKLGDVIYHTYSKAAWNEDGTLDLWIRPIETAHVKKFNFKFNDDDTVKIKNDMNPTLQDLVVYYMTFTGNPVGSIGGEVIKESVEKLGLPIIEPDFKGKFVEEKE